MELNLEYSKQDAHRDGMEVLVERFSGINLIKQTWDTSEKFIIEYTK